MKRKKLIALIVAFLAFLLPLSAYCADIPDHRLLPLLVDNADLLDDDEETELLYLLERLSEEVKSDIAVVTVNSLDGKGVQEYTDDFYDYNGYGYGEDRDGIMLLINMGERDVHISDCGYVHEKLSQSTLDRLRTGITPDLSSGDYAAAFRSFAERSAQLISDARNAGDDGNDGDDGRYPDDDYADDDPSIGYFFSHLGNIPIICIVVGIIGGFVAVTIMKGKLKSVRRRGEASDYIRNGSFNITNSSDIFLYTTVSKTARPKDDDSSHSSRGGGGGHVSSSGTSHGGSSGKF